MLSVAYRNSTLDVLVVTLLQSLPWVFGFYGLLVTFEGTRLWLVLRNYPAYRVLLGILTFAAVMAIGLTVVTVLTAAALTIVRRRAFTTPSILEINDDGLRDSSAIGRQEFRWTSVKRANWVHRSIVIRLVGGLMVIIPERSFASREHADSFLAELTRRIAQQK